MSFFNASGVHSFLMIFPPHEPPLPASSSPVPRIRTWPINLASIAMFLVTSPIVMYVPTRGLLAVETMHAIVQWLANLNIKRNMTSMFVKKKHRYCEQGVYLCEKGSHTPVGSVPSHYRQLKMWLGNVVSRTRIYLHFLVAKYSNIHRYIIKSHLWGLCDPHKNKYNTSS